MIGVKVTRNVGGLEALERTFADERLLKKVMVEEAGPIVDEARRRIPKNTGKTAAEIGIDDKVPSAAGLTTIHVGIPAGSPRAFIGRFLEFGTSKMRAQPWLRPANDAQGGEAFTRRVIAKLIGLVRGAA